MRENAERIAGMTKINKTIGELDRKNSSVADEAASTRQTQAKRSTSAQQKRLKEHSDVANAQPGKHAKQIAEKDQPVQHRRDPFDEYFAAMKDQSRVPKKKTSHKKSKSKKRSSGTGVVCAMLLVCIGSIALLGLLQHHQYRRFLNMRTVVDRQTFYDGTTVEGMDVSGMTLSDALTYWAQYIEPDYSERTVSLSNGMTVTAAQLGYSSNYATALSNAWNVGRTGSLAQRYAMVSNRVNNPLQYEVTRQLYRDELVEMCVNTIAEQVNRPAKNASIESFDVETYAFVFADEEPGSRLDTTALTRDIKQTLDSGNGSVELVVETLQPDVTREEVEPQYGMITYAVTNASSSTKNRLANIQLAMELINGTCLEPGETFSFNATVGKRTTDRGFKVATAYSAGEVIEEVGGGICQVSTTLFNAAVKADCEIVERHNHSLTVNYVDRGKDAAVNWSSQDLRFTNTSDDKIYICCMLTDDKRVRIGIFGKLLPNGEYITVEGVTTDTIDFETVYQINFSYPTGTTAIKQAGKNGYEAVAYKIRWDVDGNRISKELLCKSAYKATNQIIEYGP